MFGGLTPTGGIVTDPLDEMAEEFFPGSKRRRREPRIVPQQHPPAWDAKPRFYDVSGERTEFFTIGALAEALDREIVTIRSWISRGVLPEARYKLPPRGKTTFGAKGGQRLWTRAQIEAIAKIAQEEGLLGHARSKDFSKTQFTQRVIEALK